MTPWKVKRSLMRPAKFTTTLDTLEREVLGTWAAKVADALMERARSAPKDELAEMMDMPSGHKDAPEDPGLARLLPDFERDGDEEYDGDNALLRSLHESDIITGKLTNLQAVISALGGDDPATITLSGDEVPGFIAGLNDMRLYLAACEMPGEQEAADRDNLIEWLAFNQESLLQVFTGGH